MKKLLTLLLLTLSLLSFSQVRLKETVILNKEGSVEDIIPSKIEVTTNNKDIFIYNNDILRMTLIPQEKIKNGFNKKSNKEYRYILCYLKENDIYVYLISIDGGKAFMILFEDDSMMVFR